MNNLYLIDDEFDDPIYVLAENLMEAITKWKLYIQNQQEMDDEEFDDLYPESVRIVAEYGKILK